MSNPYFVYTTNNGNFDGNLDAPYSSLSGDDSSTSFTLSNAFVFNGSEKSILYLNSNGLINFTTQTSRYNFDNKTSKIAGFYIMGTDLETNSPDYIRFKELENTFVIIYNDVFVETTNRFQVKITLYLKNSNRSGTVVADFGIINNSTTNAQLGISFGTNSQTNIIQPINFLNYSLTNPYIFNYPNSPNLNVTNIQSNYSNKQLIISLNINNPCFKEGTKILCLNKNTNSEEYKFIENLRKNDLIKTLLHGYKPINMIGKREMYHQANVEERLKDQLYICSKSEYPELFEDLVITGCHSILVDKFVTEEQRKKVLEVNGEIYGTDNKYRLPACADNRAKVYPLKGTYTIYHLALENEDYYMNYGIYANGLLVETCSKRYLKELSNMELIE